MSSSSSDPATPRPGGMYHAYLARMRAMEADAAPAAKDEVPLALPVAAPVADPGFALPVAAPIFEPVGEAIPLAEPIAAETPTAESAEPVAEFAEAEEAVTLVTPTPAAPPQLCHVCDTPRSGGEKYCAECGCVYPEKPPAPKATPVAGAPVRVAAAPAPVGRLKGRYALAELLGERGGVRRFRGLDFEGAQQGVPVVIVAGPVPVAPAAAEIVGDGEEELLPTFDFPFAESTAPAADAARPSWPSVGWERSLLADAAHPGLPKVVDQFVVDDTEYLVEEVPTGQLLWDAWEDPQANADLRYLYLKHVAEILHVLHEKGAMLEGLRPDIVVVGASGLCRLTDLSDLLPLPLPPDPPIRATLYSAPELVAGAAADARSDLYGFGAMVYALHLGRELTEKDLKVDGNASAFIPRFPDAHPLFARLLCKTLCKDPAGRFPTDEAAKTDPTGFGELMRTLEVCRRVMDNVRLEIACWTTTGIVRTGNEDGFALLHAAEARQDDLGEAALVLLCDGMGGYEAGEVAAALAVGQLRKLLLAQPAFAPLAGASPFPENGARPDPNGPSFDVEVCKRQLRDAMKETNRFVFTASRSGIGRRGMGCTAEAVYVNGRYVVVSHVGDSRTYHLHEGQLKQLTRDQTLVNRLVELGQLSAEEAENHPRKNELQQAVGGQPDVEPGVSHGVLSPGDWVVVCSDGVTNHVKDEELREMLQQEASSAEMAARRLVNLVNLKGATDNATVVVIRAT